MAWDICLLSDRLKKILTLGWVFPDEKIFSVHLPSADLSKTRAVFLVYARAWEIKAVIHKVSNQIDGLTAEKHLRATCDYWVI